MLIAHDKRIESKTKVVDKEKIQLQVHIMANANYLDFIYRRPYDSKYSVFENVNFRFCAFHLIRSMSCFRPGNLFVSIYDTEESFFRE